MKKYIFFFVVLICVSSIISAQTNKNEENRIKFNPASDPYKDLDSAVIAAQKFNKNIILDVGGEWCIWCHRMDWFIEENPELNRFLKDNYITVKVNYSEENKNEKFLSQYPKIKGYPHIFVLSKEGKLLHSQDTGLLEKEKSYDLIKYMNFLKKWAPQK